MTLTQLSYIVAVDKYRHFATAAQKIYITQPTLSMQIQKLEDELGVLIFDRSKSPVIPTEIGKKIIEQAKVILSGAKHIQDIAAAEEGDLKGSFKVGIIPTVAPYLVPLFLKHFVEQYPNVELIFEEKLTSEIVEGLHDDELDVGIIATANNLFEQELYLEPFLGYISAGHEMANKEKLELGDLYTENLWLLNEGHCFRDQVVKLCKKENQQINQGNIVFESGNLETLKRLVEQDFGVTLMPYLAVREHNNGTEKALVKEFVPPIPTRKIRLVYSREFLKQNLIDALSNAITHSIPDILKNQSEELVLD